MQDGKLDFLLSRQNTRLQSRKDIRYLIVALTTTTFGEIPKSLFKSITFFFTTDCPSNFPRKSYIATNSSFWAENTGKTNFLDVVVNVYPRLVDNGDEVFVN
jgi:hypothetical protein